MSDALSTLTSGDYAILSRARQILNEAANDRHSTVSARGYVAGYAEAAEAGIFNFLNRRASYLGDTGAQAVLQSRQAAVAAANAALTNG